MNECIPNLVSTRWLAERLGDPQLVVLDASQHLLAAARDARAEFAAGHIPGARFLDLESLVDTASDVPRALPRPDQIATRMSALGVPPDAAIILYDDSAIRSSARGWFTLSVSGWHRAAILDGGLSKWRDEDFPMESGLTDPSPTPRANLKAPENVVTKADLVKNCRTRSAQVIDARSADRVYGAGEDPVHGGSNGRIPGSHNLPFDEVFAANGTYRSPEELHTLFERAGVDLARPVITTCGSGITASVLLFALRLLGKDDARLYDGSWLEWGADPATPKAKGPA